jgi:hypothetical protein
MACAPIKNITGGGKGDDTGGGGDTGGENGGPSTDGESPWIDSADAWCYLHEKGDSYYNWIAELTVDDPQGDDTVESFFEGLTVYYGDTEMATYYLVCGDGTCNATFKESENSVLCSSAEEYTMSFRIIDGDDNWSDAYEIAGREGTSSAGR